jgi:catechol 2,3-dioxygenase-like lactoylglutathione lyase family enzyme
MANDPRIVVVILYVSDLERSVGFYGDLLGIPLAHGANEPADDPWYGGRHAEFSWRDGAYLHFALFPAQPPRKPPTSGAEIGLIVTDVHEVHRRAVAAGVEILHEPRAEPWGATARYRDPDGNIVGVTSR